MCFHLYCLNFCISLYRCANVICIKLLLTYLLTYLLIPAAPMPVTRRNRIAIVDQHVSPERSNETTTTSHCVSRPFRCHNRRCSQKRPRRRRPATLLGRQRIISGSERRRMLGGPPRPASWKSLNIEWRCARPANTPGGGRSRRGKWWTLRRIRELLQSCRMCQRVNGIARLLCNKNVSWTVTM